MTLEKQVADYHRRTKHDFHRFAASLGYLDWATQPHPFRHFQGAPSTRLPYRSDAPGVAYDDLFVRGVEPRAPLTLATLGDFLRHALGLSAWKQAGSSRWALRVDPSSGNLHPTEGYVVVPALAGLADDALVGHYVAESHALEMRATLPHDAWPALVGEARDGAFLVGLTSITWREAWKYGERAFRYCLHDTGHALAALSFSAALFGWKLTVLSQWSSEEIAAVLGLDRTEDFHAGEAEEPELIALVSSLEAPTPARPERAVLEALRSSSWHGRANVLSESHAADWEVIDAVARATRDPGGRSEQGRAPEPAAVQVLPRRDADARRLFVQRRSALALDGRSSIAMADFLRMMRRALPGPHAPWDAMPTQARVHLALFVHRVVGLAPGLHVLVRDGEALSRLRAAMRPDFEWTRPPGVPDELPLYRLLEGDCTELAARLSCDQDIAGDGFFSLGMIAEFAGPIAARGPHVYRELFWESGVIGQVLYLEAEAAGARSTGIGCYYDDPVHRVLGLTGDAWQSLYHFTVGVPVEDLRLTTLPAYPDEVSGTKVTA